MPLSIRTKLRNAARNVLPARYRLGYEFLVQRLTGRLEPELLYLHEITPPGRVAIDIGANQGFYSFALARRFERVLAFEPNPSIVTDLERCSVGRIELHRVALSAEAGSRELYVPQVGGVEQHGWASFDRFNLPGVTETSPLEVPVRSLDSYRLEAVDFIKIDVEGHEPEVLSGAMDTLRRNQPVVLAEVRASNFERVRAMFDSLDYTVSRLIDGVLVPWTEAQRQEGENFVFAPRAAGSVRRESR
jgi:FkbM family methyltransferase